MESGFSWTTQQQLWDSLHVAEVLAEMLADVLVPLLALFWVPWSVGLLVDSFQLMEQQWEERVELPWEKMLQEDSYFPLMHGDESQWILEVGLHLQRGSAG